MTLARDDAGTPVPGPSAPGATSSRATPVPTAGPPVPLARGLWQVAGPGITHPWDASGYLLVGERAALIDPGSGLGHRALDSALAACGTPVDRLSLVAATHGHFDHVGDGARLVRQGQPVLLHPLDAPAVRSGDAVRTCAETLYGTAFDPFCPQPLVEGQRIDLGGASLEVLHTPGHTPGSVCFVAHVDSMRILLAGDTLWGAFSAAVGSDESAWRTSLERLSRLRLDAMSFGHGPAHLLGDPAGRIAEARARFATYFDPWFRPPRLHFRY